MTDYIFLAGYQDQAGLFAAPNLEAAHTMAWDELQAIVDDPEPELFFIRAATRLEVEQIQAVFPISIDGEIYGE